MQSLDRFPERIRIPRLPREVEYDDSDMDRENPLDNRSRARHCSLDDELFTNDLEASEDCDRALRVRQSGSGKAVCQPGWDALDSGRGTDAPTAGRDTEALPGPTGGGA